MEISKKNQRNLLAILEFGYGMAALGFMVWYSYLFINTNGWVDYLVLFGWLWCSIKGALWPVFIFF